MKFHVGCGISVDIHDAPIAFGVPDHELGGRLPGPFECVERSRRGEHLSERESSFRSSSKHSVPLSNSESLCGSRCSLRVNSTASMIVQIMVRPVVV